MMTVRMRVQNRLAYGSSDRERKHAEDRHPDDELAAEAIADGAAEDRAGGDRSEEDEQIDLRVAHRHAELADQIKRVVAAQARQVEVLGEDQGDEHADRHEDAAPRQARTSDLGWGGRCGRANRRRGPMLLIPAADLIEHDHREERDQRAPRDAQLPARQHEERREQRAHAPTRCSRRPGTPTAPCHAARPMPCARRATTRDETPTSRCRPGPPPAAATRDGPRPPGAAAQSARMPMPATSEYGV